MNKPTVILLVVSILVSGCNLLEDFGLAKAGPCDELYKSRSLKEINYQNLPYRLVYVDSENYAEVVSGKFDADKDGSWSHKFTTEVVTSGNLNIKTTYRDGTLSCSDGDITIQNDGGTGSATISDGTLYVMVSGNEWIYE